MCILTQKCGSYTQVHVSNWGSLQNSCHPQWWCRFSNVCHIWIIIFIIIFITPSKPKHLRAYTYHTIEDNCSANCCTILRNILGTQYTVVPFMRDHKSHLKKRSLKRGLPYLVGNQELKPLVSLPDYPPNQVNPFWETVFWGDSCGLIRGTTVLQCHNYLVWICDMLPWQPHLNPVFLSSKGPPW